MTPREIRCEEVIEQLFEFLDQELDEELNHRIERHLEHCRDCFTRAEFEKRLRARIDQAAATEAPETLRRRLRHIVDTF